jgi:hypothetical protein
MSKRTASFHDLREVLPGAVLDALSKLRNSMRPRAEKKLVYLHIGAHKTGTTAIQSILRAESRRLKWFGYYYDRRFYRLAKFLASRSPLNVQERQQLSSQVTQWFCARPEPSIIASAEALFGDLVVSYANIGRVAEDIRAILGDHDVRIVACIRRQDDFIQSVYHQHIKRGGALRFDDFLREHDVYAYRWNELLANYVGIFGRDAVSVLCYDDVFQTPTGVVERLFPPLAASGFRSIAQPAVRNPSLSRKGLELAVRCNELLEPQEQRRLRRFLQATFHQRPGEKHTLFSDEQRRELLDFYRSSNKQCVDDFGMSAAAASYLLNSGHPETQKFQT